MKLYFQSLESQGNNSDLLSLGKIYFLVDSELLLLLIKECVLRQYCFKSQLTAFISVWRIWIRNERSLLEVSCCVCSMRRDHTHQLSSEMRFTFTFPGTREKPRLWNWWIKPICCTYYFKPEPSYLSLSWTGIQQSSYIQGLLALLWVAYDGLSTTNIPPSLWL